MFFPIKYGLERASIDVDEYLVRCPSCESDQWADVLVSSVYSHFYYIPLFPVDKDAMVCCKKCGLKRYGVPFGEKLIKNYPEVKKKYRHRWFTYIGLAIIITPVILLLIFSAT